MKGLLGVVIFLLFSQGIGGLVHEFTDGRFRLWSLVYRVHFLDGYQVYVSIALIVLGIAVSAFTVSSDQE